MFRMHLDAIQHPIIEYKARDHTKVSEKLKDIAEVRAAETELANNKFWQDCLATNVVELKLDAQVCDKEENKKKRREKKRKD